MAKKIIKPFKQSDIKCLIFEIRGVQVIIDRHLAQLYGVTTGQMNQQVKRNIARFPDAFRFQLTESERDEVITKCDNLQSLKFNPSLPFAFTEQGIAQLSSVLHTPIAIETSVKMKKNKLIETERLILRPWQDEDADALYKYASDPDIGPIAGWPPHTSVAHSREIIRTVFAAPETYAVVLKATNEPVGCCGIMFSNDLHTADMKQGEAEIGYWIGKPYWGQGLIPEAVKALLARCFNELHLHAVWCGFYEGNTKSKRVCEKSGFKFQHTHKDIESPLGDKRTEHFYILTKEDYRALPIH